MLLNVHELSYYLLRAERVFQKRMPLELYVGKPTGGCADCAFFGAAFTIFMM